MVISTRLAITVPAVPRYAGQSLGSLALHAIGVAVVSVRKADGRVLAPDDTLPLSGGDTLVLSGLPEPLALAEAKLLGA